MSNDTDSLTVIYKCRRCGIVFSGVSSSKKTFGRDFAFLCVGKTPPDDGGWAAPTLLHPHACKDGCLGIGDLTGAGRSFTKEPTDA